MGVVLVYMSTFDKEHFNRLLIDYGTISDILFHDHGKITFQNDSELLIVMTQSFCLVLCLIYFVLIVSFCVIAGPALSVSTCVSFPVVQSPSPCLCI